MDPKITNYYHDRVKSSVGKYNKHPIHEKGLFKRNEHNPIIESFSHLSWANRKIYNAAVIKVENEILMLFRAMGDDHISRIGLARSNDGVHFTAENHPIFSPEGESESHGAEDPRVTYINGYYVMGYTAYDGRCAREAVAVSTNLKNWRRNGPIFPAWHRGIWNSPENGTVNWSKAGAVFPEKFDDTYLMLFGDDYIWPAYSKELKHWEPVDNPVLLPREGYFDAGFIEMGPPPMKTEHGWLVIYHGIESVVDRPSRPRIYRLGAALLDLHDPTRVIWRCTQPLLEPLNDEQKGMIDITLNVGSYYEETGEERTEEETKGPFAIFTCGALLQDDIVSIYYSSMDTAMNLATCSLDEILTH